MPTTFNVRLDETGKDADELSHLLGTAFEDDDRVVTHDDVHSRSNRREQPILATDLSAEDAVRFVRRLHDVGATATIVTDEETSIDADDLADFASVLTAEDVLDVDLDVLLEQQPAVISSDFSSTAASLYDGTHTAMILDDDGESLVESQSLDRLRIRAVDETGQSLAGAPVRILVSDDEGTHESIAVNTNRAGYVSYDLSHIDRTASTQISVITESGAKAGKTVTSFRPNTGVTLDETIHFDPSEFDASEFDVREDLLAPPDAADAINDPETFDRAIIERDGNCAIDFTTNVEVSQHYFNQIVRLDSPRLTDTFGSKSKEKGAAGGNRAPITGAIPPTLDRSVTDVDVGFPMGLDFDFDIVQSEQPTLGKLNTYNQTWTRVGHGIGKLLYSLALAPCEETNIAVIEWSREESASRRESGTARERLQHELHRDRTIEEAVDGVVDEVQRGGSESVQGGGGLNLGFISIGGGAAGSSSFSKGHRRTALDTVQSLADRVTQRSSAMRTRRSMVVTESKQAEREELRTRTVRNHNRNHALTVEYFQVLEHFLVDTRLDEQTDVLLVPYKVPVELWSALPSHERFAQQIHAGRDPRQPSTLVSWLDQHAERLRPLVPREHRSGIDALYRLVRTPEIYERDAQRALVDRYTVELNSGWRPGVELIVHTADETIRLRNRDVRDGASVVRFTGSPVDVTEIEKIEVSFDPEAVFGAGASNLQTLLDSLGVDVLDELIEYTLDELEVTAHTKPNRHLPTSKSYRLDLVTDSMPVDLSANNRSVTVDVGRPVEPEFLETTTRQYRDYAAVERFVTHLQSDPLAYLRALWLTEDADARALRLDRYVYGVDDGETQPLLELIENRPVGVVGNLIAFPLLENGQSKTATQVRPAEAIHKRFISLPTRGIYADTLLSKCNATERRDISRTIDEKTACGSDAPPITGVTPGSRRDRPDTTPSGFPAPMVNIQNPQSAPAPTGMGAGLGILGASDLFRDMSLGDGTVDAVRTLAQQGMIESGKSQRQATETLLKMLAASQGIPLGDDGSEENAETVAPSGSGRDGSAGGSGSSAAERKESLDALVGSSVRNADPVATYDQLQNVEGAWKRDLISDSNKRDAAKNIVGAVDETSSDSPQFAGPGAPPSDGADDEQVCFFSGECLPVVDEPTANVVTVPNQGKQVPEHWDPLDSGNPLLDASGEHREKQLSPHFSVGEFARSGNTSFEKVRIDPDFIVFLEILRSAANEETGENEPITISSGYRSYKYNIEEIGGAAYSPHSSGYAADIKYHGSLTALELAKLAIKHGGRDVRVGYVMSNDVIHVDIKPRDLWGNSDGLWSYPKTPTPQDEFKELEDYRTEIDGQLGY